jgi:hypothetical protein
VCVVVIWIACKVIAVLYICGHLMGICCAVYLLYGVFVVLGISCTVYMLYCVLYIFCTVGIDVCTLDAGLLARSQYSEGPATGHLDTRFPWFSRVF